MPPKTLHGSCLCKKITYRVDLPGDVPKVILCHCTACKSYTGSAFSTNIEIPLSSLHYLTGTPKLFTSPSDTGTIPRHFCSDCGSPLTSGPGSDGVNVALKTGTLDEEGRKAVGEEVLGEIYVRRREGWMGEVGGEGATRRD